MQFAAVLYDSFRESIDRKMFWVIAGLSLLVALAMSAIAFTPDHISLFFGAKKFELPGFDPESPFGRMRILSIATQIIVDTTIGWVGVLLMIISTAGFFPTMLEKGAIDGYLAKPISRWRYFIYKYVASLSFVAIQSTFFCLLIVPVVWLRWGIWAPGLFAIIPLITLLFSYLYGVCVWVGVLSRSTLAAIMITICAWFIIAIPPIARSVMDSELKVSRDSAISRAVDALVAIFPKTEDVSYLAARAAGAGIVLDVIELEQFDDEHLSPEERVEQHAQLQRAREQEERKMKLNPYYSIGTSLAFEAFFVGLAMLHFCRRDF